MDPYCEIQSNMSSQYTLMRGQPVIRGRFLITVICFTHVKEPVMKVH